MEGQKGYASTGLERSAARSRVPDGFFRVSIRRSPWGSTHSSFHWAEGKRVSQAGGTGGNARDTDRVDRGPEQVRRVQRPPAKKGSLTFIPLLRGEQADCFNWRYISY